MPRVVNATFINGEAGWSFLVQGKVAPVIEPWRSLVD